jgi:hypothetical protein
MCRKRTTLFLPATHITLFLRAKGVKGVKEWVGILEDSL